MPRVSRYFHIEYILIFIAVLTFSCTAFFKFRAVKNFDSLDRKFIALQEMNILDSAEINIHSGGGILQFLSAIEKDSIPYTYFNKPLERSIHQLSSIDSALFGIEVSRIQNEIHKMQREISFGYDSFFYFSAIIIMVAVSVIITKKILEKADFERRAAINEEQKNFSRNLHDGVAQDLAAIKIYNKKGDSEKLSFYTNRALNEVRYLIDSSRVELDEGLESAVKKMLDAFESNHGIKTTFLSTSNYISSIKSEWQIEILHIMQEILSNISRHANASEVKVRITDVGEEMRLSVSDNGIGFSAEGSDKDNSGERKHWGLNNIRERTANMNGTVQFINDGGTTVAIRLKI